VQREAALAAEGGHVEQPTHFEVAGFSDAGTS
jgi:hypothetical protein